eukprot:TRINITY_DN4423_c0_g1_i1.p1 TRINITY_DN4423_c0_g1~~TRINITY_DN4423_c0_g1_i1.p1  ORF type:complete len:104 (+),score=10.21 TRINITY_DN4423_c0_g1_i1:95-406(+)
MSRACDVCGGPSMSVTCRGCKSKGLTGPKEVQVQKEMGSQPRKPIDQMTEQEILEECCTYSALKNGDLLPGANLETAKAQARSVLQGLPPAHLKIMLEQHRKT